MRRRFSSEAALKAVLHDKILGSGFHGNAFTEHGKVREPEIARWVAREHGIPWSTALFHAAEEPLHLATPDGVVERDGQVLLCEIKTTGRSWRSIPRSYLRQVWWQQYVLGAERTLVVWEQHDEFMPRGRAAHPVGRPRRERDPRAGHPRQPVLGSDEGTGILRTSRV